MSNAPSAVIYVDIDDPLVRSFGSKRIPMTEMVALIPKLKEHGATLFCWSSGGAAYARRSAEELGIAECFTAFLPMPQLLIDDVSTRLHEPRGRSRASAAGCRRSATGLAGGDPSPVEPRHRHPPARRGPRGRQRHPLDPRRPVQSARRSNRNPLAATRCLSRLLAAVIRPSSPWIRDRPDVDWSVLDASGPRDAVLLPSPLSPIGRSLSDGSSCDSSNGSAHLRSGD